MGEGGSVLGEGGRVMGEDSSVLRDGYVSPVMCICA